MAKGENETRTPSEELVENGGSYGSEYDDDGHLKRTGTWVTASAHIITTVIGSGVLSLGWVLAQLGWVAGILSILIFSFITLFTSHLIADKYRSPDPVHGRRNHSYIQILRSNLGGIRYMFGAAAQYGNLVGFTIGYTITASISMEAIKKSNCFHKKGHDAPCNESSDLYMIIFGIGQIILSQIPNFRELSWLSIVAAITSFGYAVIGMGLSIARIAGGPPVRTSISGTTVGVDVTKMQKVWKSMQALGNIAFSYAFIVVLVEIQDTLKSNPPENQTMKKANNVAISITTSFYLTCGILGYAAFGNEAPGNFLSGFGFYEPYWLVDIGNLFVIIHLVGAYQVFCQPVFKLVEDSCKARWPENRFIKKDYLIFGVYNLNFFRLLCRAGYVIVVTVIAMVFPFFNDILGLIGAFAFWPLAVYFPIEMHLAQSKLSKCSFTWISLKFLSGFCFIVSLVAAVGSIQGLIHQLQSYKPFHNQY